MEARRESSTVDTKRGQLSAALLSLPPNATGREPNAQSADDILFSKGTASAAAFRRLPAQVAQNEGPGDRHVTDVDTATASIGTSAAATPRSPLFRARATRFALLIAAACAPILVLAAFASHERAPPQPVPRLAAQPPVQVVAATATPSAPPRPASAKPVAPALDIAALVAQGSSYLDRGDIASARLYFEKAAEADDSRAAILMGATYDPAFLARLKTRGLRGNVAQAIRWYRRARTLGAPEAAQLLAALETR